MPSLISKRYVCHQCGSALIVTKAGTGTLKCCAEPMALKELRPPTAPPKPSQGG